MAFLDRRKLVLNQGAKVGGQLHFAQHIGKIFYGDAFATADAEFFRGNSDRRGRQTQSWVKFADGWKVVSAHVSLEGSTS